MEGVEFTFTGTPTPCLFDPVVEYRFSGGTRTLVAKVCFACSEVQLVNSEGRVVINSPFREAREALLEPALRAFPKDPILQSLK
jgi:hypothetical protein